MLLGGCHFPCQAFTGTLARNPCFMPDVFVDLKVFVGGGVLELSSIDALTFLCRSARARAESFDGPSEDLTGSDTA